jgi:hypothetical protein
VPLVVTRHDDGQLEWPASFSSHEFDLRKFLDSLRAFRATTTDVLRRLDPRLARGQASSIPALPAAMACATVPHRHHPRSAQ